MASSKKSAVPNGSFALQYHSTTGACPRCAGLPTLRVVIAEDKKERVLGYVVADWPWDTDIPEDPAQHPAAPHYVVEYFAQDSEHRDILGISSENPHFIARAIHDAHRGKNLAA